MEKMIKTSKETIYDLIKEYSAQGIENIDTRTLASELKMQRSNVSAILNSLVQEGRIVKTHTRPVYYGLPLESKEVDPFESLIGSDGSLSNAIKLAKAAILYPGKSLNSLIIGDTGSGKSLLTRKMFDFAKQQRRIRKDAEFVKINCRHYINNTQELMNALFGDSSLGGGRNLIESCNDSILVIENIDTLDLRAISLLNDFLETGNYKNHEGKSYHTDKVVTIITMGSDASPALQQSLMTKVPVKIVLPEVTSRGLQERLDIINAFLYDEVLSTQYSISVPMNVLHGLMLVENAQNLKYLERSIKVAVATAYLRVYDIKTETIKVVLEDFDDSIQSAAYRYKHHRDTLDALLPNKSELVYTKEGTRKEVNVYSLDFYDYLNQRIKTLTETNVDKEIIDGLLTQEVNEIFNKFRIDTRDANLNIEHLSKVVDKKLIDCVVSLLETIEKEDNIVYPTSITYALCLHINALIKNKQRQSGFELNRLDTMVEKHPVQYKHASLLSQIVNETFGIVINHTEVKVLTMFFIKEEVKPESSYPQLLIAMHGNATASSLAKVVNDLVQVDNTYSYDMGLDVGYEQAYEEIKQKLISINTGSGVIVMYDMGSLKMVLERVSGELDFPIRLLYMPVTLFGIEASRKASMDADIDNVYHALMGSVRQEMKGNQNSKMAIITLCHTGEGGAVELKKYMHQYYRDDIKIYPLAISDRKKLIKEILQIKKFHSIQAIIGTYDPKIFGIPFIPVSKVFEMKPEALNHLIVDNIQTESVDFEQMLDYLSTEVELDKGLLKKTLPEAIDILDAIYSLNMDQKVGLFLHIGALVNRLVNKVPLKQVEDKSHEYQENHMRSIQDALGKIEKAFKVIVPDSELHIIYEIVNRGE